MKTTKLILTLLTVMFTSFAISQSIVNSDHDFSNNGWGSDEICIFCHTPHDADNTVADAPLWNHDITTATFIPYDSPTLDATVGQPLASSKLCLSCHDGTVALDNYGGSTGGTAFIGGGDLVGTDLRTEHPISFTYDAALVTADGGLNDPASGPVLALLLGDQVECASCHDVHNATGLTNLLTVSNASSALCLTCHAK